MLLIIICSIYGYLRRSYWPRLGKSISSGPITQAVLSISAFLVSVVAFFLGIKFATDFSKNLIILYPLVATWFLLLVSCFVLGYSIHTRKEVNQKSLYFRISQYLLSKFVKERFVPDYSYTQFQDHVSKGSCLVIYREKIYVCNARIKTKGIPK